MDREQYAKNLSLVPDNEELILDGGNHAQFGDYGEQDGDGRASLQVSEQLDQTVEAIDRFIKETRP